MPPATLYNNGNGTWLQWNQTATSATNVTDVWLGWNQTTVTASTTNVAIWASWTGSGTTYYEPVELSPEDRERRQAEAAERTRLANEAKARARTLLLEVLDEQQRAELESDGHFHVHTRDGERTYRLKPGSPPQRIKGEDGSRWSYCIHPRESFPADDTAAALKLMIEAEEASFLDIANATHLGRIPVAA